MRLSKSNHCSLSSYNYPEGDRQASFLDSAKWKHRHSNLVKSYYSKSQSALLFSASLMGLLTLSASSADALEPFESYTTTPSPAASSSYTGANDNQDYTFGNGNDLNLESITANGGIIYTPRQLADQIFIRRVDNAQVSGERCNIFLERSSSGSGDINSNSTFPVENNNCSIVGVLKDLVVNRGVLDIFSNAPPSGSENPNNIERVDFIFTQGIKASSSVAELDEAGHIVMEKSGNNPVKVAAVTAIDGAGNPTEFSDTVVTINTSDYGLTGSDINNNFLVDASTTGGVTNPEFTRQSNERIGGVLVTLADFGIGAGEIYYGFAMFGTDVDENAVDLLQPNTFPSNTPHGVGATGGADWQGGMGGFWSSLTSDVDYGDAPDTYGTDGTGSNSGSDPVGASHTIDPDLFLGATVPDADINGFVDGTDDNGNATDDDDPSGTGTGNGDDEDDFTLPTLTVGDTDYTISAANITATNTTGSNATLHAWIDFDNSGTFESTEHTSVAVNDATSGGNPPADLTWNGITVGAAGDTYARFRLTTDSSINNTTPGGAASDGEVEDYQIAIASNQSQIPDICEAEEPTDIISFLDNPTRVQGTDLQVGAVYRFNNVFPGVNALIEVLQFNDGASLANIDNNSEGELTAFQPTLGVSGGTDTPSVDFKISLIDASTGAPAVMNFRAAGIDIDGNGNTLREFIELTNLTSYTLSPDTTIEATPISSDPPKTRFESNTTDVQPGIDFQALNTLVISKYDQVAEFNYSIGAITGGSGAIERLNSLYIGCAERVKDYSDAPADGDTAPDGGTTGYGEASHIIVSVTTLGTNIDLEPAPQNSAAADGDDNDGTDDDDGVTIPSLTAGQTATITAQVAGTGGYLQGWIDWNGDGSFDAGEQVATDIQDNQTGDDDNTTGTISFDVDVPADAITTADTFGRFRWSTTQGLDTTTAANDGEVEDYQIAIADARTYLCPDSKADIWFANDESGSVSDQEFDQALDFLYQISDELIFDDDTGIKAGITGWTQQINSTEIIIPISESFADPEDVGLLSTGNLTVNGNGQGIRELYTSKQNTNPGTRLDFATSYLANLITAGNGRRTDAPQIAVILTDAEENHITQTSEGGFFNWISAANQLKSTGATIVLILIDDAARAYDENFIAQFIVDNVVGTEGAVITVPNYQAAANPTFGYIETITQAICDRTVPVASDPELLLAKRITAINPGQPDEIQFNDFTDDFNTLDDNHPLWPDSDEDPSSNTNLYLRGVIDGGQVKPDDEVEYTIYFLSSGNQDAQEVNVCDVIPDHMAFVKDAYGLEVGIALGLDDTTLPIVPNKYLSNLLDDDEGDFYGPGTTPPGNLCEKIDSSGNRVTVDGATNTNGAIIVRPSSSLPPAVSPGQPTDSYGFIRFRAKVK